MASNIRELKPIPPNPPRWEPSTDPESIVIPGLDTTASINDQVDQIDQLITLKLQDIDADFSDMQHVLSTRILPAFRRFSIATEPVREAAKFWTSFYEQAAQVRIPTYDDPSSIQEPGPSGTATEEEPSASSRTEDSIMPSGSSDNNTTFDAHHTPSESSFVPAQAAFSSTPAADAARTRRTNDTTSSTSLPSVPEADAFWGLSVESPLVRLDRELRDFARPDPQPASTPTSASIDQQFSEADITVGGQVGAVAAGETARAPAAPSSSARAPRRTVQTQQAITPPRSLRPNPAAKPARNPYLPADTNPRDWSGIVDLRSPQPAVSYKEDDDPTFPVGMSPPVMVPFATLSPSLGRSPAKSAATNIRHALVRSVLRGAGGASSSAGDSSGASVVPTPPSLSRYAAARDSYRSGSSLGPDLELNESTMHRVGLPQDSQDWYRSSTSIPPLPPPDESPLSMPSYYTTTTTTTAARAPQSAIETPLPPSELASPSPAGATMTTTMMIDATPESDSASASASTSTFSSSSEYSVHDTAHPSAAFLLASRQRGRNDGGEEPDDDAEDDEDDSLMLDADAAALAPVHPFARARSDAVDDDDDDDDDDDYYDDSFDSFDGGEGDVARPEETVFGVRRAEREGAAQPRVPLRMFGEELLQDTIGIGAQLARAGRIEESPTPWGGGGRAG